MGQQRGRRVQAILFDLDGTLYPNHQAVRRAWSLFVQYKSLFLAFREVRSRVRNIRPIYDLHALQAQMVAEKLQIAPEVARDLIDEVIYTRLIGRFSGVKTFKGTLRVLTMLRDRGVVTGVLSDLPPNEKLEHLGLLGFDYVLTSETTNYLKPNPEPFLYAAEQLTVHAENVMYVGNHYQYDILGARAVGMLTAHRVRRKQIHSQADLTFFRYDQLISTIDSSRIHLPSD